MRKSGYEKERWRVNRKIKKELVEYDWDYVRFIWDTRWVEVQNKSCRPQILGEKKIKCIYLCIYIENDSLLPECV